jgi:hypothetical protein
MRPAAFEQFAKLEQTRRRLAEVTRRHGFQRLLFIDLGKNFLAYEVAAATCGLRVIAIVDARLGGRGLNYHGIPLVSDEHAMSMQFDAAIVSNLSPVHAAKRYECWKRRTQLPVLDLFKPPCESVASAA